MGTGDSVSPARELRQRSLLAEALRRVVAGGPHLVGILLAVQVAIALVCLPLIRWLFRESLRAAGMTGLDLAALQVGPGLTVTVALLATIVIIAFWIVSLQFTLIIIVLELTGSGQRLTLSRLLRESLRVTRKLFRPSAFPLVLYLFLVLPLTGFGFTSTLMHGVAIPPFVTGELLKSDGSAVALVGVLFALLVLSLRWSLAVPLFVLTDVNGARSLVESWRLTRGFRLFRLIGSGLVVFLAASVVTVALITGAIVPTAISDEVAPAASPLVAAFSLGVAQTAGFLLTGLVTAMLAALLMAFLERHGIEWGQSGNEPDAFEPRMPEPGTHGNRRVTVAVTAACIVIATALGTAAVTTLGHLDQRPETLVLGHRGFPSGGVENTISGLDAAKAAGADLVEMDVMQTADGGFVAMHDANLERLTGHDANVKDLTLDEITNLTAQDREGRSDRIPAFSEYVQHAAQIEMPLLIEIKLGGADLPGFVEDLVAELEDLGALEANIYHSLDAASVTALKTMRPDLTVGYTMAFAAVNPPETAADFIVVEEWTASEALRQSTRDSGLGFYVWTVNSVQAQHKFLRRGVDGMITDEPAEALSIRTSIGEETGLADTLIDLLQQFVVVF